MVLAKFLDNFFDEFVRSGLDRFGVPVNHTSHTFRQWYTETNIWVQKFLGHDEIYGFEEQYLCPSEEQEIQKWRRWSDAYGWVAEMDAAEMDAAVSRAEE